MAVQQQKLLPQACIKGPNCDDDDDGLGALISGHAAQKHEEKRKIEVVGENKIGELVKKYEIGHKLWPYEINEVLTPDDINVFLQVIMASYDRELMEDLPEWRNISSFVSRLIQASYDAGHNHFRLDTTNFDDLIDNLGKNLKGHPNRKISVQIDGDVGESCGYGAEHSSFIINGDAVLGFGQYAEYSSFTLNGRGIIGDDYFDDLPFNGRSCDFKTTNEYVLETLMKRIPKYLGHKIYFIHSDGREELMRKDNHAKLN